MSESEKSMMRWGRLRAVLTKNTVLRRTMDTFYNAVIQTKLLYGSETWMFPQNSLQKLEDFHHRNERFLEGSHIHPDYQDPDSDQWITPATAEVL